MGDYHARFCERFKVKLLLSTRLRSRKTKEGRLTAWLRDRFLFFLILNLFNKFSVPFSLEVFDKLSTFV